MTADCIFNSWATEGGAFAFLYFSSGAFTINGNGHSIIGPSNSSVIVVQNANATLNLNNVIIQGGGGVSTTVAATDSATLNASDVIFRNNTAAGAIVLGISNAQITLENVQFLDNRRTDSGGLVASDSGSLVVITNGAFRRNAASRSVLDAVDGGRIQLAGCMIFDSNTQLDDATPLSDQTSTGSGSELIDNSSQAACLALTPRPKRKKEEKAPTAAPTSTPRPQIAATHVALQAATGATFRTAFGLDSGVHFRQLDGAGIGVQSIIDAGYLEAFDVYGYVEQGVEVCFPQIGRVIFLDARTMPRAITPLESTVVNGQTCVSINSPGSLVLLPN